MKSPTIKQIGELHGISPSSVSRAKAAGIDVGDPDAMMHYLRNRKHAGATAGPGAKELNQARKRKIDLECQRLQFEMEIRKGEFVEVEQIKGEAIACGFLTREVLTRWMRSDLPPRLSGLETGGIAKELDQALYDTLHEMADGFADISRQMEKEMRVVAEGGDPGPFLTDMAKAKAKAKCSNPS